ncbi:MAG: tetratricopeptide repeat protein [Phycisphaerae bacterium]|nr:tetratricopeptide repeat protein [Phycisphaerae bacterium]
MMSDVDVLWKKAASLCDVGAFREAAECCERALQEDPHDRRVRTLLGSCQWETKQLGRGAATFRELIDEGRNDSLPVLAFLHRMLGLCLSEMGQWKEAEDAFSRCVQLEPSALSFFLLGAMQARLKPLSNEPVKLLRKAIDLAPDDEEILCELGRVLRLQHRYSEAIDVLRRAAELWPESPDVLRGLGAVLRLAGKCEAAEEALSKALKLNEDDARTHLELATLLAIQGVRGNEQAMHLRRATELRPDLLQVHSLLGGLCEDQGKSDEAAFHLCQAECLRRLHHGAVFQDAPASEPQDTDEDEEGGETRRVDRPGRAKIKGGEDEGAGEDKGA